MFRLLVLLFLLIPVQSMAWGNRGHAAICEAASFLVKEKSLKEFLQMRSHIMGHICNIPDTYWRDLGGVPRKAGGPAHYLDPEIIGIPLKDIPLVEYKKLLTEHQGQDNKFKSGMKIQSLHNEFGSLWWRVDEMMRRISKLSYKDAKLPEPQQYQNNELPYNKNTYELMVYMGILGHYIGDAAQPLHNTADYDGYKAGHGGLHGYYESDVVAHFGPELPSEIYKRAQKIKSAPYLSARTPLEKIKAFSEISYKDIPKVLKLDPVIKKSEVKKEKGMELRTEAVRKPSSEGHKVFKSLILDQMARSAALLAHLWDEGYKATGSPDLSQYRSYRYPFTPDFIVPDYLPAEEVK